MKKFLIIIILVTISSLWLSGCTGGAMTANSWPGLTVNKEIVYVAYNTSIMAIRLNDGNLIWQYPSDPNNKQTFFAQPAADDNLIVVGDYNKNLYGLDPQTGNEKWSFPDSSNRYVAGALLDGDYVFAPSTDNTLYALNSQGVMQWKFTMGHAIWAKPVSDKEMVYVASLDHHLYAFNKIDGREVWNIDLGGALVNSPLLSTDGNIYIGSLANELVAIQASSGKILWRFSTNTGIWSTPTQKDDSLYFSDSNGIIYAVNTKEGNPLWQLETNSVITSSGAAYSDGLFFTSEGGDLLAIGFEGNKLWSHTIGGKLYTTPVVSGDNLLVASTEGDNLLICLDLKGNQRWTFQPPK